MSSSWVGLLFLGVAATVAPAAAADADAVSPAEAFVAAQFSPPPPAATLAITGQVAAVAREILGHPYAGTEATYWRQAQTTAWVLQARGRSGAIVGGFVVTDKRLSKTQVLVSRERRGKRIGEPSFARQFDGASLTAQRLLDRRVDGITGATVSSDAVRNMARLALYLDSLAATASPGGNPEQGSPQEGPRNPDTADGDAMPTQRETGETPDASGTGTP